MSEKVNYFDSFIEMSNYIVSSSEKLNEVANNFNVKELESKTNEVHELENNADRIVHKIGKSLIQDFLPPIDREDISEIAHRLDDIEDSIDELLINIKILNIKKMNEDVKDFTAILMTCTNNVKEIFVNLKNFNRKDLIIKQVIRLNKIEEEGDRLFEKSISDLYRDEKNAIELIKWDNIYNCLENAIDNCEKLGDVIEDVILKNS